MEKEQYEKLIAKAFFYLKIRQRTEAEMRIYLSKKAQLFGASSGLVEQVICRLKELNYLDDASFAESHIRSRSRTKPKGEYLLKQELKAKGVSEHDISSYFENHELDEDELAKQALVKKWSMYKRLEYLKRRKRATDFLLRRGFSYDSIRKALETVEQEGDTER